MFWQNKTKKKLEKCFGSTVSVNIDENRILLTGELDSWVDIVKAGRMAVNKKSGRHVVNHIRLKGYTAKARRKPLINDSLIDGSKPDVLVIGGGICGCAVARELARYNLKIMLIDKENDVAMHSSSRNDGMVHPGIDLFKGSSKHTYNLRGNKMYDKICSDLDVPFQRSGQYLCFRHKWIKAFLYCTLPYWKWSGLEGVKVIGKKELKKAEPGLDDSLAAALFFPTAGSVCPYGLTIAYGENAIENGAEFFMETMAESMEHGKGEILSVKTNRGTVYPRIVVNVAGTFADEVAAMAGDEFFTIHPRRGTNSILDSKVSRFLANTIVSAMGSSSTKTKRSKGGGVVSTVDGNLLIGPDAVETPEREDFSTSRESIENVFSKQRQALPNLREKDIITYFIGVRAPTYEEDFIIGRGRRVKNLIHGAGIQSPGITAAPAIAVSIAEMAVEALAENGEKPEINGNFKEKRKGIARLRHMADNERAQLIKANPDYGVILCRCEEISKGEILDAIHRPLPCKSLDGIKRRVRPGMGRCQGGFCSPLIVKLISEELGIDISAVEKNFSGSNIVFGEIKGGGEADE